MYHMAQAQAPMYSASVLEYVVSNDPQISYSATIVSDSSFAPTYSISNFTNTNLETSYLGNQMLLSTTIIGESFNPNYLTSIMASYGADPHAIRAKENSFDLMSVQSNSLTHVETNFQPSEFVKPKAGGIFVAGAEEIQDEIQEAFEKLMGEEFPSDIKISILPVKKFRKLCSNPGVVGISYNRRQLGLISEIFVLEGSLASVMLTIGHEIGHVLTPTLSDPALEEAKAYAFSFAWMDIINEFNIAGLANAFVSTLPAINGVHDKGYNLVKKMLVLGEQAYDTYRRIVLSKVNFNLNLVSSD